MKIIIDDGVNQYALASVSSAADLIAVIYEGPAVADSVRTLLHEIAVDLSAFSAAEDLGLRIELQADVESAQAWLEGGHWRYLFEPKRGWRKLDSSRIPAQPVSLEAICAVERRLKNKVPLSLSS